MKFILLVTFTVLAVSQVCIGAAVPKAENTSMPAITDAAIDLMGASFLLLPNADKEKVGILTNVLKRINKNITSEEQIVCGSELLYLGISNKNSTLTLSEWKQVINESIKDEKSNGTSSSSSSSEEGLNEEGSKLLEQKLSGIVASEEAKRIINTLNGFRNDATSAESNAAMYDLFVSAIVNTLGIQPEEVRDLFNNETSNESSAEENKV